MIQAYEACDGRLLLPDYVSTHHVIWERGKYRSPLERTFRSAGGLSIKLAHESHRELHANVPPPPKPNTDLMRDIVQFSGQVEAVDPYDHFNQITAHLFDILTGSSCERNVEDAGLLLGNLLQQSVFIEEGQVTPIRG